MSVFSSLASALASGLSWLLGCLWPWGQASPAPAPAAPACVG
jgi:hypothetical protein